jgi:hypothetical protein
MNPSDPKQLQQLRAAALAASALAALHLQGCGTRESRSVLDRAPSEAREDPAAASGAEGEPQGKAVLLQDLPDQAYACPTCGLAYSPPHGKEFLRLYSRPIEVPEPER